MPKAVEIENFAAKLHLVCKRLNWSRAKLAQQVGVDKSLAGRWLAGASRPAGNSLMRLNDAIARALPDFTAASWDVDSADLALQLGLTHLAPAMAGPVASSPAASPPATMADTLAAIRSFSRFADDIDHIAPIYTGFYWVWFSSFANDGAILRRRARLWREGNGLRFENIGGSVIYTGGCIAVGKQLYMIMESPAFPGPAMTIVSGAFGAPRQRMSGLTLYQTLGRTGGTVCASPSVLEFIEPLCGDPAADLARWEAMAGGELSLHNEDEMRRAVAPEILSIMRPVVGTRRADGSFDHLLVIPLIG